MQSVLKNRTFPSILANESALRPTRKNLRRSLIFTISLTSLIDAFSILVIYLLINYANTNQALQTSADISLPSSMQSESLKAGVVISVKNGKYFIDHRETTLNNLTRDLLKIGKAESGVIIEADKTVSYASLSPIILASSHAGYEKFRFAVVQKGNVQ